MKFAIFGNTYQAKKSSHAENLSACLPDAKHNFVSAASSTIS